jgi:hypothetical protein
MKLKNRYVFGAALAAAAITPALDGVVRHADAAGITAAGFGFEGLTQLGTVTNPASSANSQFSTNTVNLTLTGVATYTVAADVGSGTVTMSRTGSAGSISAVAGNGTTRSLSGNNLFGATSLYTFKFNIDDLDTINFAFDTISSASGPRDFLVSYSLDGVSYSTLANFAVASFTQTTTSAPGTTSAFWIGTSSQSVFRQSFALPASFSDANIGVAGDFGYLRLGVVGSVAYSSVSALSSGTNRLDNVLITGSAVVPEPAAISILPLAAAALSSRRRKA